MGRVRNARFCKIILPSVHGDRKLRIPPMFLKKYRLHLSGCDSVYLQVPNGSIWEVELVKHEGGLWLNKGWQEFAEYYSIAYGHFLVFSFHGNSHFRVFIYDTSGSEIEYPVAHGVGNIDDHEELEFKDDADIFTEISNDFPLKTMKTRVEVQDGFVQLATIRANKRSKLNECGLPQGMQSKRNCSAREVSQICTHNVKDRALRRAEALKCNGPRFMVQLTRPHVSGRFRMPIPSHHAKEYLVRKHDNVVLLGQGPETKTWFVKCYSHPKLSQLTTGWKYFALDNHLAAGDVCVFELVKTNSYKVFIFHAADRRQGYNGHHGSKD